MPPAKCTNSTNVYTLTFDGSKQGRKLAGFGYSLEFNGRILEDSWGWLFPDITVVQAELAGLSNGLDCFIRRWDKPHAVLKIYGDSKIALGQAPTDPVVGLKLKRIKRMGVRVEIHWLPRRLNKADALAKSKAIRNQ